MIDTRDRDDTPRTDPALERIEANAREHFGSEAGRLDRAAERFEAAKAKLLRPAVLWRMGSFGSDSESGNRFAERLLTVVASCRQQGWQLLDFLVAAGEAMVRGVPPPSLLPAPQGG